MRYLISYDLTDVDKSVYEEIDEHLKNLGAKRVLRTEWVLNHRETSATDLLLWLMRCVFDGHVDRDCYKLAVVGIGLNASTHPPSLGIVPKP